MEFNWTLFAQYLILGVTNGALIALNLDRSDRHEERVGLFVNLHQKIGRHSEEDRVAEGRRRQRPSEETGHA